jgi:DNA-binding transcriptional LysR family regulator
MWQDITARHLLALRAAHEEGTFGRAGDRLGFTQSAVSQQIAALEKIVGQQLFDRRPGPNPPTLNVAGELVLSHAERLLGGLEDAEHEVDRLARGLTGSLSVGTFQSVSARVLPLALRRIYDEAPDVDISLVGDDPESDFRRGSILRGDLDLAFIVGQADDGLESHYLGADPHVAIVPADEPLGLIELAQVKSRPLIGQPEADSCGALVDRGLERLGVTPRYAFRSHDNGAVQGMVAAGVGIAIVPLLTVDTSDPRISVRQTEPALEPRHMSIIWSPHRSLPPIGHRLIEVVAEICDEQLSATVARTT